MSSFNDQAEYLRKKKEEILARKKKEAQTASSKPHTVSTALPKPPASVPFANDGSFLEKFKAMQQKTQTIKQEPIEEPTPTRGLGNRLKTSTSATKVQRMQETARIFKEEPVETPSSSSSLSSASSPVEMDFELARELAEKVHKEGVQAEMMARIKGRTDPRYQFLFNETSPVAQFYQTQLQNFKRKNETATTSNIPNKQQPVTSSSTASPSSSSADKSAINFMSEFEKAKALVRAKAAAMMSGGPETVAKVVTEEEQRRQREVEEQKMMNNIYMKVIQQQMSVAKNTNRKRKRNKEDKPKYEYDSDEDVDGGTWEHKKRTSEMQKTAEKALELTEDAKGKHHISDFLPPDELEKFLEKVKAVKEGREVDFSDYAKYKIGEENIGYKMLQKAGWQEGSGLGSKGEGITAPINKGKVSFDQGGIGTEKVAEVKQDDDDFDVYRKRMMLAYKFRPNPLNNPRRPYYE